jgi:hypothetical protein
VHGVRAQGDSSSTTTSKPLKTSPQFSAAAETAEMEVLNEHPNLAHLTSKILEWLFVPGPMKTSIEDGLDFPQAREARSSRTR